MFNKKLISLIPEITKLIAKKAAIMWVSLLCGIGVWLSFAYITASSFTASINTRSLCAFSALIIICAAVRFALTRAAASVSADIADKAKTELRLRIYDKVAQIGGEYAKGFSTAEITQLASEGVEQAETYFTQYLPQLFYSAAAPLTLFAVFFPISRLAAVVLLLCIPLIPIAIASVQMTAKRLLGKYWDSYTNLGDTFLENLQGLTTLKIYGADKAVHEKMNEDAENFRRITMKVLSMQLNSITIMDLTACGGAAAGILIACFGYVAGNVTLFGAIALVFLSSEFFVPMRLLGSYFHIAMNGAAASDKIFKLLEAQPPKDGEKTARNSDISAKNLSFSYDGKRDILKNISFTIKKNSMIGICGESGCGKSTLAGIISGRIRTYSGDLRINGDSFMSLKSDSIYKTVMYAGCGDYIFTGTIRETLADANIGASDEEMYEVLERVNLAEFVRNSGGLDMKIEQNAANISGGQKQRLALARAFLKNSEVYIFDEITSNIDAESERIILDAIKALKKEHTIIIVSHKLTNIADADEIYFIRDGKIAEQGTHNELMKNNGEYSRIYSYQKELEDYTGGFSERSVQ